MRRVTLRQFFSFRYSQNTLWATFVAFLVFSLFFWLSKHAKGQRSDLPFSRKSDQKEREKRGFIYAWAEYYLQPNTVGRHCALADHYLWQLIAGHVMGCEPTKRQKNLQRMIIIRYSTSSSLWLGSAVEPAFICRWMPFSVNKKITAYRSPYYVWKLEWKTR